MGFLFQTLGSFSNFIERPHLGKQSPLVRSLVLKIESGDVCAVCGYLMSRRSVAHASHFSCSSEMSRPCVLYRRACEQDEACLYGRLTWTSSNHGPRRVHYLPFASSSVPLSTTPSSVYPFSFCPYFRDSLDPALFCRPRGDLSGNRSGGCCCGEGQR